ncbi:hypothetical protein OG723_44430 (plasmid) [Streptomyces sp. NBC_01278]|uniref:hypothetical protein n=1 Tax=Streptomyces sp. NBC_01278 TaxID=2903809 RepID=UPI002E380EBC|nr:hypothetical protein [Streptomyces sp. NBC_01278]
MPTCTDFAHTLTANHGAPTPTTQLAVNPGDVLHYMGARLLVLNSRIRGYQHGERQSMTVVALTHADTLGIGKPWEIALTVTLAGHHGVTVEQPAPDPRRWWLAVTLDDRHRFVGANGYQESADCSTCADTPLDPASRNYVPCKAARAHAWNTTGQWEESRHRLEAPRSYYVLPVIADTWEDARTEARDICERLRTDGHL